MREVGRALVMTHDYARAVNFYERTLSEDPRLVSLILILKLDLRTDLAELCIKLKYY